MQNHIFISKLRLWLGRYFYILKRHFEWIFSDRQFATELKRDRLPIQIFTHQSILLRQLKDVEMWLQYNKIENLRLAITLDVRIDAQHSQPFC